MIVGFVVKEFNGHEDEAVAFIQKVCVLSNPDVAKNIVSAGPGINIFTDGISQEDLDEQPFVCSAIEVSEGEYLVASAVDFIVELSVGEVKRLAPSEYLRVPAKEVPSFMEYERQGVVRIIPEIDDATKQWILRYGVWNDSANWTDSSNWKDDE